MKTLIIDRFEENFAVCEDDDGSFFAIDISELPAEASEGDVLRLDDGGGISVDEAETESRRSRIREKMLRLKNRSTEN